MKQIKLDKETKKTIEYGQKIKELTLHEGWGEVRTLFLKKVGELLNLKDVDLKSTNLINDIAGRQLAAGMLTEIIVDIEGTAEQFDINSQLTEEIETGYVIRKNA